MYSPQAWEAGEGFGGAQGALNAVELVLYGVYAMVLWRHGVSVQEGGMTAGIEGRKGWLKGGRRVEGWRGNRAVLIGFAASVMTLSKTVLYCKFVQSISLHIRDSRSQFEIDLRKKAGTNEFGRLQ